MKLTATDIGHWILIALILYFSFILVTNPTPWIFPDYLNLLIHEAGHLIFSLFGQFMFVLGGSLFQIVFPVIFLVYFLLRNDYFSVSVMLFWVADNIINVSVYARDAQAMQLPLLGGDSSGHDWHWLLGQTGLLPSTQIVANSIFFFGVLCLSFSIVGMIYFTVKKSQYTTANF